MSQRIQNLYATMTKRKTSFPRLFAFLSWVAQVIAIDLSYLHKFVCWRTAALRLPPKTWGTLKPIDSNAESLLNIPFCYFFSPFVACSFPSFFLSSSVVSYFIIHLLFLLRFALFSFPLSSFLLFPCFGLLSISFKHIYFSLFLWFV